MGLFRKSERVRLFETADELITRANALMAHPRHEVDLQISLAASTDSGRKSIADAINGMTATRAWLKAQVKILDAALEIYGVPVDDKPAEPKPPVMA